MSDRKRILDVITERSDVSQTISPELKGKPVSSIFGMNTFGGEVMKKYLPPAVCAELKKIIREGGKVDEKLAEKVADGLKKWAIARGATHFTHWFHPMTGLTAEKHDSFITVKDGKAIEKFSASNLIQGEPDASSFPSGGLRSTFEARGYTAWDPTSPAFLAEGVNGTTLCIPTVFLSYTGEALDKKAPLLRSMDKLSEAAVRILRLFGNKNVHRVYSTVGPEQEYFLVDKAYYSNRPDLVLTGRTLFGAKSPKGQEMEDHYFGSIRERVQSFMHDSELELFKLGIPVKTRHNEVAPAQFEIAPIFEDSNIATDHNQIVMETLKKFAARHDLALLLHEKPFAGINGSGKHNNWSLADSDGNNLLEPGKTPHANIQFMVFLLAAVKAVFKYPELLRAAVATAGNDHRLGANEAPPAIISVFLGKQLEDILNSLETNRKIDYTDKEIIDLGISKMPAISRDNSDRNRTSPFAFTGNKFEFRAVGSSHSIAMANYTLNTIMTDILTEFHEAISLNLKKSGDLNKAVMEVVIPAIKETKPVRFEGNNYSAEWEKEAAKRGLPNKKNSPDALKDLLSPKNKKVFTRYGVLTEAEVESIYAILVEQYVKTVNIEAETALTMAKTIILPAALRHQALLSDAVNKLSAVGGISADLIKTETGMLAGYTGLVSHFIGKIGELESALEKRGKYEEAEKADFYCKEILPLMAGLREIADHIESETADDIWPLPKYREMLFVY